MGKVAVKDVILRNHADEIAYQLGNIPESEIREIQVELIADTGARVVGLPLSLVQKLGLPAVREINTRLADGSQVKRTLYGELSLQIGDRKSVFECLGKPEKAPLLLGQMVLEGLDLVVDCPNERLIPNPEAPEGMMLYDDF